MYGVMPIAMMVMLLNWLPVIMLMKPRSEYFSIAVWICAMSMPATGMTPARR